MFVSEYDAFGPWIYEVDENHPLPPLFVPYYKEDSNCLMIIKIPRNIERRNAEPSMDLYDYVIALYENYIYMLKRIGKNIEESRFFYKDIEGIEDLRQILDGALTLYLKNTKLIISYNTVSSDIIMKFIKIIRDRYTELDFNIKRDYYYDENLNIDNLYINLLRNIKSNDQDIQISAVQSSIPLKLVKGSITEMIEHFISGTILLNTLHLTNNKELIIITRGRSFNKNRLVNYDFSITYIPFNNLSSIIIGNYEKYSDLVELNLKLTEKEFKFYFEQTNNKSIDFYNNISNKLYSVGGLHDCNYDIARR